VLSGELDSITTPAEGAMVAGRFPDSRVVHVANSFHVTAEDDSDGCAVTVLRRFVRQPARTLTAQDLRCTRQVPPVRALGRYYRSFTALAPSQPSHPGAVGALRRRAVTGAAETVADLVDRWFNNYSSHGVGLYGGTWRYTGDRPVQFRLHHVRLVRDLAIGGTVQWARYSHHLVCTLTVRQVDRGGHVVTGAPVNGTLHGHWDTRRAGAVAALTGRLGGRRLHASMPAP
jgi:hypothetical protein